MIAWPIFRDKARRRSRTRAPSWHRDDIAAARSISRWEDDGGSVGIRPYPADARLSTDGHVLPPEARRF